MRENLTIACKQQRCRTACATAQADQRLCYSLSGKYSIQPCSMQNFNILASLCSCAGWFEPHLVIKPEDWFSYVEAQLSTKQTLLALSYHLIENHVRRKSVCNCNLTHRSSWTNFFSVKLWIFSYPSILASVLGAKRTVSLRRIFWVPTTYVLVKK